MTRDSQPDPKKVRIQNIKSWSTFAGGEFNGDTLNSRKQSLGKHKEEDKKD